jgi:AraC-like DNA-binding protein
MEERTPQQAERAAQRMAANRAELVERLAQAVPTDGTERPLPGLAVSRRSVPEQALHSVTEPSLAVIAQGSKEVLLGETRYRYDPAHYLLTTVGVPCTTRVLEASPAQPYLSLRLELPPTLVGAVLLETGYDPPARPVDVRAMDVSPLDADLLDALVRLVRLVGTPGGAAVLLPLITRELVYRLLVGAQGARLRYIATQEGATPAIARAVGRIRQEFDQPLRVEDLAGDLGMSVSGFHHHFKAVTAMSPLQFQKQLRLQEARRLMLGENLEAATAAARVGYQDAAYFNREYKSLFGVPPMRDIQQLRHEMRAGAGLG